MADYSGFKIVLESFSPIMAQQMTQMAQNDELIGTMCKIVIMAKKIFVVNSIMFLVFFTPAMSLYLLTGAQPISLFVVSFINASFAAFSFRAIEHQMPTIKHILI